MICFMLLQYSSRDFKLDHAMKLTTVMGTSSANQNHKLTLIFWVTLLWTKKSVSFLKMIPWFLGFSQGLLCYFRPSDEEELWQNAKDGFLEKAPDDGSSETPLERWRSIFGAPPSPRVLAALTSELRDSIWYKTFTFHGFPHSCFCVSTLVFSIFSLLSNHLWHWFWIEDA